MNFNMDVYKRCHVYFSLYKYICGPNIRRDQIFDNTCLMLGMKSMNLKGRMKNVNFFRKNFHYNNSNILYHICTFILHGNFSI